MVAARKIMYIRSGANYNNFQIMPINSSKYIQCIEELNFAISSGDNEFAPAMRLILREALELVDNQQNYTAEAYQRAFSTIKSTYYSLLDMPTKHPVATQLRMRFKTHYSDNFWSFVQDFNVPNTKKSYQIVASDGNINKYTYFIAKRIFDVLVASVLLVLLSPVLLLVMLLIKLDSPGPVFFVQKRMGSKRIRRCGMTVWQPVQFDFYKLRSMYTDADESTHEKFIRQWMEGDLDNVELEDNVYKMKNDPRVTRIGAFIRKTSIDELPQLFNVIKGDMSLVGPRPVPLYEAEAYGQAQNERLASVPGITGLWQVKGRGRTTFSEQVQMDVAYIYQQSILRDLQILINTPLAVIKGTGAY